jgi:hypothetical protein
MCCNTAKERVGAAPDQSPLEEEKENHCRTYCILAMAMAMKYEPFTYPYIGKRNGSTQNKRNEIVQSGNFFFKLMLMNIPIFNYHVIWFVNTKIEFAQIFLQVQPECPYPTKNSKI